ncbi:MAG: Hpt domain-containing protein [Planctomycetales bacterium]|nr:Hpt domain-containing protein [Planctomycetales bacterium]
MIQAQTEAATTVVDVDELLSRCLGNLEFAERIIAIFQARCSTDLEQLEEAIDQQDLQRVAAVAHRLKGACANAAAHPLCERISQLRQAACANALDDVTARFQEVQDEWAHFVAAVPELQWKTDG